MKLYLKDCFISLELLGKAIYFLKFVLAIFNCHLFLIILSGFNLMQIV
jgi:hypothetical protein